MGDCDHDQIALSHGSTGRRRAFTLLELLVVVAIIAILTAIAVVNLSQAQERALMSADAGNLHAIATALQSYYIDYGTLPLADVDPIIDQTLTSSRWRDFWSRA